MPKHRKRHRSRSRSRSREDKWLRTRLAELQSQINEMQAESEKRPRKKYHRDHSQNRHGVASFQEYPESSAAVSPRQPSSQDDEESYLGENENSKYHV